LAEPQREASPKSQKNALDSGLPPRCFADGCGRPAPGGFAPAVFFASWGRATGFCTRYRFPLVGQRLATPSRSRRPKMEDRAEEQHWSLAYGKHGKYRFFQGRGRYGNCRPYMHAKQYGGNHVASAKLARMLIRRRVACSRVQLLCSTETGSCIRIWNEPLVSEGDTYAPFSRESSPFWPAGSLTSGESWPLAPGAWKAGSPALMNIPPLSAQ